MWSLPVAAVAARVMRRLTMAVAEVAAVTVHLFLVKVLVAAHQQKP
jgi:hypothetical protein